MFSTTIRLTYHIFVAKIRCNKKFANGVMKKKPKTYNFNQDLKHFISILIK